MSRLSVPVGPTDHIKGSAGASATLVQYGDYQCPACGFAYPVVRALQLRFGSALRFVFRNFPLVRQHPEAMRAAITAEFAAAHGQFWPVHDALYEHQDLLGMPLYERIVAGQHLGVAELHRALDSDAYVQRIETDFDGGVRSGVDATPSFFINGFRYEGPIEFAALAAALEQAAAADGDD